MTDTEFKELDLNTDIPDMEGDEARETLADFMQAHRENRAAYDAVVSEFQEKLNDIEDQKESVEEKLGEIKSEYAEKAAEVTNMPADLIDDRFEFSEIEKILVEAEEAGEFSEDSTEEDDEDSPLTSFSEKPEKGKRDPENTPSKYSDTARALLSQHGVPVSQDD